MDTLVIALINKWTELWFGLGCSGHHISFKMNGNMVWAWMLWSSHLFENKRSYGLGVDDLVIALIEQVYGIMVWAWMIRSSRSLENERNHGLGMDALVIALIKTQTGTTIKIKCCRNGGLRARPRQKSKTQNTRLRKMMRQKFVKTVRGVFRRTVGTGF